MKLLTLRIPETEHLPVAEREAVIQRCLASEEMRRYKRAGPAVFGITSTATAFGFFFMALFRWSWSFLSAFISFVGIAVACVTVGLVAKVALEAWLLRRLIRKEIRE